jgi:uncharacterized protein YxjI
MRYLVPPGLLTSGRVNYVETETGERVFAVGGVGDHAAGALSFFTLEGDELCTIHHATLTLQTMMHVARQGQSVMQVHKLLIGPTQERYAVERGAGDHLMASGAIGDREYAIRRGRRAVATVSARWANRPGGYGVQIAAGEDASLLLAAIVCIGLMSHGID